jgi:probable selenium-dependent hydroxylase accessory protein YqeC
MSLLLVEADEEEMLRLLLQNVDKYTHITLASRRLASGKLNGISRELVIRLAGLKPVTCVIVEADGAAHRSLKAPNLTEPVIPANTSLVIPVVGIDAVGCRLTEGSVFRPEIVSRLLELPIGEIISVESIAVLLTHHQGIIKGSPDRARIVPFINKVELDKDLGTARKLATKILAKGHPQIKAVVSGRAQSPEPVVEVIHAG